MSDGVSDERNKRNRLGQVPQSALDAEFKASMAVPGRFCEVRAKQTAWRVELVGFPGIVGYGDTREEAEAAAAKAASDLFKRNSVSPGAVVESLRHRGLLYAIVAPAPDGRSWACKWYPGMGLPLDDARLELIPAGDHALFKVVTPG